MVSIEDKTKENLVKKEELEKKGDFLKNFFGNFGKVDLNVPFKSIVLINKKLHPLIYLNKNQMIVYTPEISQEKLRKFGEEYEKMFKIKDLKILIDYSDWKY